MRLVLVVKTGCKCVSCGENVRGGEGFWQGQNYRVKLGKYVDDRKERYCSDCEGVARVNCVDDYTDTPYSSAEDPESKSERMREAYAGYDTKEAFWRDADAGHFG